MVDPYTTHAWTRLRYPVVSGGFGNGCGGDYGDGGDGGDDGSGGDGVPFRERSLGSCIGQICVIWANCVKSVPFKILTFPSNSTKILKSPVKFIIIHRSTADWSTIYWKPQVLICNRTGVTYAVVFDFVPPATHFTILYIFKSILHIQTMTVFSLCCTIFIAEDLAPT